jgi:hypothetical protein
MGYLVTRTGSFVSGLAWLLANLFLAGILILCIRIRRVGSGPAPA